MDAKVERLKSSKSVVKEELINCLDEAIVRFNDTDIDYFQLTEAAQGIWNKIVHDPMIKKALDEKMRNRRDFLDELIGKLDIAKNGDPVEGRYNPDSWLSLKTMPKEFKGIEKKESAYIFDKVMSLRGLLESL